MRYLMETERLGMRSLETEDAACLYENHREDEVKKWIPNECYRDLAEAEGAIRFFRDSVMNRHLPYVLAVEWKESGALIGDIGINAVEGKPDEVEIGYTICKAFSGQGCATEAVKAMCCFCKESLGAQVLFGRVLRGNDASVRVLEKNGFAFIREEFGVEDDPEGRGMLVYRKLL